MKGGQAPDSIKSLSAVMSGYFRFAKRETLALDFIEHKCNSQSFQNSKLFTTLEKT